MTVTVEWDQWFRCGRTGDDTDFETHTMEFDERDDAIGFMNDLLAGHQRGLRDLQLQPCDIRIIE